jgi:hypothetical protein
MRTSILAIATLGMAAAPAMADTPACSAETVRGFYAFLCEGHATALPPAPPSLVPMRYFGTCSGDRTAFFHCEGTYNAGGDVVPVDIAGQAFTNPDCTGTITYDQFIGTQPIGQLMIRYVVLDGGDTLWGMPTGTVPPSALVSSCHLRRIHK